MKLLEIVHPAAKVLVDISASQDAEVRHATCRSPMSARCGFCWRIKTSLMLCAAVATTRASVCLRSLKVS